MRFGLKSGVESSGQSGSNWLEKEQGSGCIGEVGSRPSAVFDISGASVSFAVTAAVEQGLASGKRQPKIGSGLQLLSEHLMCRITLQT